MLPNALVINTQALAPDPVITCSLSGAVLCEWQNWEKLGLEDLRRAALDLIIINAPAWTEKAESLFRFLSEAPLSAPVLALLPQECSREILDLASRVSADFLFHPVREDELRLRASRLLDTSSSEVHEAQAELRDKLGLTQLIGNHPEFLQAVQQALLFRKSDAPVLITGETGTGKELFAHAIHSLSRRCDGPFIPLDCGVLPEQLAENELFGHRRGAYTDAHSDQKGLAALAERGTLFLDEIDSLSPANQSKFLRLLQEGSYRALGSDRIMQSNIRIIAATNRPIEEAVRDRQFRNDLYFRLNVLRLNLPPLRRRAGDISLLARHFLNGQLPGKEGPVSFSAAALQKLESYHWPGNVRELLNTVQRAIVCCSGPQILPIHIVLETAAEPERAAAAGETFHFAKQMAIEKFERAYVEELMARFQGSVTRAAREAGKERRAFGRLIKKYGISRNASGAQGSGRPGHL
ncbi:MAG TPA: sigma-54 dependent transcriptional regulator [Candidatus Limnocylindrales bacterium]|nr:sigma-54 dependent transcriptional regulator [Candidatus Limnocylindrales bacterium]